jgi:uncharacterized membrane-anchored protein YhcB (DUF1043 family)
VARTRLRIGFYILLVFVSGVLVGAVSHRLYVTSTVRATTNSPRTLDEVRKNYLADLRARVGVNDQQIAKVNAILDDTKRKFDDLHRSTMPARDRIQQEQVDAISAVLTPEQKVAYDNWRAERARLHEEAQRRKKQ